MRSACAILCLLAAVGCDQNECEGGQAECVDDLHIRRCLAIEDGFAVHYEWDEARACFPTNPMCAPRENATGPVALCASSTTPDPRCAEAAGFCADGVRYECIDGYAVLDETCPDGCAPDQLTCR
jgi:hypothetical protein